MQTTLVRQLAKYVNCVISFAFICASYCNDVVVDQRRMCGRSRDLQPDMRRVYDSCMWYCIKPNCLRIDYN